MLINIKDPKSSVYFSGLTVWSDIGEALRSRLVNLKVSDFNFGYLIKGEIK